MTYREALAYLDALGRFGMKLGLERTQALLHAIGDPHDLFQGVHVAGTNGKGSVCAMLASILEAAGYRVGLMTKPHLVSYTERIQVDQRPIPELDFAGLLTTLQPVVDAVARTHGAPTEFEVLTAAALSYYARAGIDLLVCEVGLGGRLDSTNVLDLGISVITNIGLDHTQHLGSTLEAIAAEKAGILKPESIAITAARPPALGVIESHARRHQIPLLRMDHEIQVSATDHGWGGLAVTVTTPTGTYPDLRIPLIGLHQAENAALAVAAVDGLRARGWEISQGALRDGLAKTRWPGRLEVADRHPVLLLDAGHNLDALRRVLPTVHTLARGRLLTVVFGAMKDKDLPAMLAEVRALEAAVVFSGIAWHRAADPAMLARLYGQPAQTAGTAAEALRLARDHAGKQGIVLVCGSVYLVGEVKEALAAVRAA